MKVHIVQDDQGWILGEFESLDDALVCQKEFDDSWANLRSSVSEHPVEPKSTPSFIPEGWTVEQTKAAHRVCKQQKVPFNDTLQEKEYIEKELAHRGQLDYRSRPHVMYGGAGDDW
jgi:hypothetical protein